MLISPSRVPDAPTLNTIPSPFSIAAMRIGHVFASSLPGSFAPTSILIEIFGALALSGDTGPIASGLILGLAGYRPEHLAPNQSMALLETIRATKKLRLNGVISLPFIAAEHLILYPAGLHLNHSDGVRLTAYHCIHPLITQQFYAVASPDEPSATPSFMGTIPALKEHQAKNI